VIYSTNYVPKELNIVGSKSEDCDQLEPGYEPRDLFNQLRTKVTQDHCVKVRRLRLIVTWIPALCCESINQLQAFPAWIIFPFDTIRHIAKVSLVSELSYFAPKMLDIVGSNSEDCDQLEPGSEPYVSFY